MNEISVTPVNCRCGRKPERNMSLRGYAHSLSCRCGGDEINFVSRSNSTKRLTDNWKSLILGEPYKHSVQHLPEPEVDVVWSPPTDDYYDPCPLRRYIRATGGHCSGGGGAC